MNRLCHGRLTYEQLQCLMCTVYLTGQLKIMKRGDLMSLMGLTSNSTAILLYHCEPNLRQMPNQGNGLCSSENYSTFDVILREVVDNLDD